MYEVLDNLKSIINPISEQFGRIRYNWEAHCSGAADALFFVIGAESPDLGLTQEIGFDTKKGFVVYVNIFDGFEAQGLSGKGVYLIDPDGVIVASSAYDASSPVSAPPDLPGFRAMAVTYTPVPGGPSTLEMEIDGEAVLTYQFVDRY